MLFLGFEYLKIVSFEENNSLKNIYIGALQSCTALETLDLPPSLTEIIGPGYALFYDNKAMICLSYLGTSVFTDSNTILNYNSNLVVHTLPSYSGNFGTIIPTRDGIRCAPFPIVIYLSNQLKFKCSLFINFSDIHVTLNSLVFLIISWYELDSTSANTTKFNINNRFCFFFWWMNSGLSHFCFFVQKN